MNAQITWSHLMIQLHSGKKVKQTKPLSYLSAGREHRVAIPNTGGSTAYRLPADISEFRKLRPPHRSIVVCLGPKCPIIFRPAARSGRGSILFSSSLCLLYPFLWHTHSHVHIEPRDRVTRHPQLLPPGWVILMEVLHPPHLHKYRSIQYTTHIIIDG